MYLFQVMKTAGWNVMEILEGMMGMTDDNWGVFNTELAVSALPGIAVAQAIKDFHEIERPVERGKNIYSQPLLLASLPTFRFWGEIY